MEPSGDWRGGGTLGREVPGLGRQGHLPVADHRYSTDGRIQILGKTTEYPMTQDGPDVKFAQRKFFLLPCTQGLGLLL